MRISHPFLIRFSLLPDKRVEVARSGKLPHLATFVTHNALRVGDGFFSFNLFKCQIELSYPE